MIIKPLLISKPETIQWINFHRSEIFKSHIFPFGIKSLRDYRMTGTFPENGFQQNRTGITDLAVCDV
jgi:hypothetical protein